MMQRTTIHPLLRAKLELLDLASFEDFLKAVEPKGGPTDLHKLTACHMFGVSYEEVTDEQRKHAKMVNMMQDYR